MGLGVGVGVGIGIGLGLGSTPPHQRLERSLEIATSAVEIATSAQVEDALLELVDRVDGGGAVGVERGPD